MQEASAVKDTSFNRTCRADGLALPRSDIMQQTGGSFKYFVDRAAQISGLVYEGCLLENWFKYRQQQVLCSQLRLRHKTLRKAPNHLSIAVKMHVTFFLMRNIAFYLISSPIFHAYTVTAIPFNITAISSANGTSQLECWSLSSVPVEAHSAINYVLGDVTTASWSVIAPRTTVGQAWAPSVQLTVILNGLIRITAPAPLDSLNTTQVAKLNTYSITKDKPVTTYIYPGTLKSSLLIAADTLAVSSLRGHFTEFPSGEDTILVQIPFVGNIAPAHTVLGLGDCNLY